MKTTLQLLNEVEKMGFNKNEALESIDKALDEYLGYNARKPIAEEYLLDNLYNDILEAFKDELDAILMIQNVSMMIDTSFVICRCLAWIMVIC